MAPEPDPDPSILGRLSLRLPELLVGLLLLFRKIRLQLDRSLRLLSLIAAMGVRFFEHFLSLCIVESSLSFGDTELALHQGHPCPFFGVNGLLESFVSRAGHGLLGRLREQIQHVRVPTLLLPVLLDSPELLDYGSLERRDGAFAESWWCQSIELPAPLPELHTRRGGISASVAYFVAATLRATGQPIRVDAT
jgi:hypothetical protein